METLPVSSRTVSVVIVSTLPIRNGNENSGSYVSVDGHRKYLTYKEWKRNEVPTSVLF